MNDKLKWAVITVALTLGLVGLTTACSGPSAAESTEISGVMRVTQVTVNGKQVTCVTWSDYKKGGLSCDWANAK